MTSLLSSRNLIIFGVLLLASSPQIFTILFNIVTLVEKSNISLPEKNGDVYVIPGEAQLHSESSGKKIHMTVCATNQFRVLAEETKKVLEQNFPEVPISFSPYQIPQGRLVAIQCLSFLQAFVFVTAIFGPSILKSLGAQQIPALVVMMNKNRVFTMFLAWMAVNTIRSSIKSTGAFEIYCDGQLVFSRLAEGELPALQDVVKGIRKILKTGTVSQQ